MKHKKMIILVVLTILIMISSFFIYDNSYEEEFNYVALGDSVASGRNPYGTDGYGYVDYVRDYLKRKDKLSGYVSYATAGYSIDDVINDINYNKTITIDNINIGIKKALRESDLVTISIGANDFLANANLSSLSNLFSNRNATKNKIDDIVEEFSLLLGLIKQYAKNDILVIGYYNPFPRMEKYREDIDEIVDYADEEYKKLCNKMGVYYVDVSSVIATNDNYLPNPLDIHVSIQGYEAISKEVIKLLNKNVLN